MTGHANASIGGKSLRQLMTAVGDAGNVLPVWFAMHVARCICSTLEQRHGERAPEADPFATSGNISPENVFVTLSGQVVIDFELSPKTVLHGADGPKSSSRQPTTYPGHQDQPPTSQGSLRDDRYAVGCILYELLTGTWPTPSKEPDTVLAPPSEYGPGMSSADLDRIITRLLSPDCPAPFQDIGALRDALDEYLTARGDNVTASHIACLGLVLCPGSAAGIDVPDIASGEQFHDSRNHNSPVHHDWDMALKRARESTAVTRLASGTYPAATVPTNPPVETPERAVVEFEQGLEYMKRGEFHGAMQAWERALRSDPLHRIARANLQLLRKKMNLAR